MGTLPLQPRATSIIPARPDPAPPAACWYHYACALTSCCPSLAGGRKSGDKVPGAPSSTHRKRRWGRRKDKGSVPWIPPSLAATSRSSGEGSSKY